MPFSKDILMGASGQSAGFGDPERVSQSDFEGFTASSTYSTWTYNGYSHANGNTLILASPGGNNFKEANTNKSDGFQGHSFVQYSFDGYGYGLGGMFTTSTGAETAVTFLETVTDTYVITRKKLASWVYFDTYADGSTPKVRWSYGTGSSYVNATRLTMPGTYANHTSSNPYYFRVGRDEDNFYYVQGFYSGGNSPPDLAGTGFTVTDKYYANTSTNTLVTSSTGAKSNDDAIQFGWGNYDGGAVETHYDVEFWTAGP